MSAKVIVLGVLSIITGIALCAVGIYFLSQKFLQKLNDSFQSESEVLSDEVKNKNAFRAKGSGLTAIALGAVTFVWGLCMLSLPQIISALVLIYMLFLIAAFLVLYFVFK